MPVVLDTTVGGPAANAYCSLADANTYHLSHPWSTTWDDADIDMKNRALVWATRLLDDMVEWKGTVVGDVQALLWPRSGCYYRNTYDIPISVIPAELRDATAEFARQLLVEDRTADSDIEKYQLTSLAAAGVSMTFGATVPKVFPDSVYYMIEHLGYVRSRKLFSMDLERA